jgi:hypothetical protein
MSSEKSSPPHIWVASPDQLPKQRAALSEPIQRRLEALMPIEVPAPQLDNDDGWLEDPKPGGGWPGEIDLRLSSRPPIYHLDRAAIAGELA